jgi:hypothetical protein
MSVMHKEFYETPTMLAVEVKCQGIICQSLPKPDNYLPGGDPFSTSMMPKFEDFGFKWQEEL